MQDSDNYHGICERPVVDGIRMVECNTQSDGELVAGGRGQWEVALRLKGCFDRGNKARGDVLGCSAGDREPDFGKVGLGRFG